MTCHICYVIRIFFSGKIEQAPKTGFGGSLENGRTGPLFLQVVDGAIVRDGKMGVFGKIEQIPNRSFWGEKRVFGKRGENRTGHFWAMMFVSGCGGMGCENALSDKVTCSNRSSGRAENGRGVRRTGHFNVKGRLLGKFELPKGRSGCRKEAQKAQKGTEGRREGETGGGCPRINPPSQSLWRTGANEREWRRREGSTTERTEVTEREIELQAC